MAAYVTSGARPLGRFMVQMFQISPKMHALVEINVDAA